MGKLCSWDEKIPLETAWTFIEAAPQLFVTTLTLHLSLGAGGISILICSSAKAAWSAQLITRLN